MNQLIIHRKYGHPKAGDEKHGWQSRSAVVKEKEAENEDLLSQAQAAFTEAMNENGAFAMMKNLPTDKEYIPTQSFNPDAAETIVFTSVRGG